MIVLLPIETKNITTLQGTKYTLVGNCLQNCVWFWSLHLDRCIKLEIAAEKGDGKKESQFYQGGIKELGFYSLAKS